jgi:MFS family permease
MKAYFRFRDIFRDGDTGLRYAAVLGLQMGQFLPLSFVALMLPMIFREQGLPLEQMFLFSIPAIPTWLRPLWAPYVDRTGSRTFGMRRSWFVPCTIVAAVLYGFLATIPPSLEAVHWVILVLTVTNTFLTTQDIAIDGYMVENIEDHERPVAGAAIDIARNVSMFLAWGGLGLVYREFGWLAATGGAAVLLVVFSLPGMLRQEPPRPEGRVGPPPSFKQIIVRSDNRLVMPMCMGVALLASLLPVLYPTFLVDKGFSAGDVALIAGPATLFGTLIGASIASLCIRRFGYRATFAAAAVSIIAAIGPIVWLATVEAPTYWMVFLVTLQGLALPSLFDVTFQAARLKWANSAQSATDYTAQNVAMRAGSSLATAAGGVIAAAVGWPIYFVIAGVCVSAMCIGMWALFNTVERLVERRAAEEQHAAPGVA